MHQPVVEATGVQFADAALQVVQMALLDLLRAELHCEVTHPAILKDCLVVSL